MALMSAILILGSTSSGLEFTRWPVNEIEKKGEAELIAKLDIMNLVLDMLKMETQTIYESSFWQQGRIHTTLI